ncbi:Uncharacterised protein [Mycobacteroides abscessus subsp. bolletii]|nr:Uncharacterised protein [Mycobacteroides abscessus subsp. bolletii]SKK61686.1 Uncharacterised protein [Mycobacteroides abscessus subsp. bolletii]SLJ74560.1 Uncharacterised protein [Mycobacteroides abscessus subsp. bolletii]
MLGKRPSRVQALNEQLKRHVLVLKSTQTTSPHLSQQLGNTGITGEVNPQYQGVDKEPDQLVQCWITAASDREPNRHVGTRTEFGQHHRQRGLHDHETGCVVFARQAIDPLLQFGRPRHIHSGTTLVGHQGIGPVGREGQTLGHPGQHVLPIGQLPGDTTLAVVQITQLCPLPKRVVRILDRQRLPVGGLPRTPAGIGHT